MDLSLIIPCKNLENYIGKLIESLKEQETTYKYETIFVLDNCDDQTMKVIEKSGLPCQIHEVEFNSCGLARNYGIENSIGKNIWFLDGDDWLIEKTAIEEVCDFMVGREIIRIPYLSNTFNRSYFSMVWQYCFSRKLIGDTKFPSFQPAEDDAFTAEILKKLDKTPSQYMELNHLVKPLYFYNYDREGSNMTLHRQGKI